MRQPFRLLTIGSLVGAAGATAGALVLLYNSRKIDVGAEVGKWLLTVATKSPSSPPPEPPTPSTRLR